MLPHTYVSRSNYEAQLKTFQQSDLQRQSLFEVFTPRKQPKVTDQVQNLINDYEKLSHDYQVAINDATAANESRRTYQDKCTSLEKVIEKYKHKIASNSFVVVVIDGDGAIFHQDLLTAGQHGGSDAASRLHSAVKHYVQLRYEHLKDYSVIISIFANLEGLGRKLASVGFVQSPHELRAFARSFTLHQPLFNIIDVGEGKERADYKVEETLKHYLNDVQCKGVMFGPCSDSGYTNLLNTYKHDKNKVSLISLFETTPAHRDFKQLGFDITSFPTVFRSEHLPSSSLGRPQAESVASPPFNALETIGIGGTMSYAAASRSRSLIVNTTTMDSEIARSNLAPTYITLNKDKERVDIPFKVDQSARDWLSSQCKSQNICNNYHIRGRCENEDCKYKHGVRLTDQKLLALKFKARSMRCKLGSFCNAFHCYLGHVCQTQLQNTDGYCHYRSECYFADLHAIDRRPARKLFEDGTMQAC